MATMIPCPACQQKISVDATACPKCGQPITDEVRDAALKNLAREKERGRIGCGIMVLLVFLFGAFGAIRGVPDKKNDTQTDIFNHLRVGYSEAFVECARRVEQSAKYEYKWESSKFDRAYILEKDADGKTLKFSILGDGVKFQNAFGAYSQMDYACYWDVKQKKIYDFLIGRKNE